MKTALRRVSFVTILAAVAFVAPACGGSDEGGLFEGGGNAATGGTGTGGAGTGGAATGGTGTGGAATGGAAGSAAGGAGTGGAASGGAAGIGGAGTGGAGTGGTGGDPGWTLGNVCDKLPALICTDREQCCTKTFGFDKAACEAKEKADCIASVQSVNASQATFHPERIDPCLKAVKPLLGACLFQGDLYTNLLKTANLCRGIFEGNKPPGTQCAEDDECQIAPLPNGYSGCGSQSQQCYQATIKQQGEQCSNETLCEQGLACKYSSGGSTCQPATPPGGSCTQSSQCALGYYCSATHCTTAKTSGSCNYFQHCQSLSCQNYQCTEQRPYVDKAACGQP